MSGHMKGPFLTVVGSPHTVMLKTVCRLLSDHCHFIKAQNKLNTYIFNLFTSFFLEVS